MKINSLFSVNRFSWILATSLITISAPAWAALDDFYVQPGFGIHQSHGRMGGGEVDARIYQNQDEDCMGWIKDAPDHIITVVSTVDMLVGVVKPNDNDIDPTLVIIDPDNDVICINKNVDRVTGLSGKFTPGDYQFFIGSAEQGRYVRYNLVLMEKEKGL